MLNKDMSDARLNLTLLYEGMYLRCNRICSLPICLYFDVISETFHEYFYCKRSCSDELVIQLIDFIVKVIVSQIVFWIRCESHVSLT